MSICQRYANSAVQTAELNETKAEYQLITFKSSYLRKLLHI